MEDLTEVAVTVKDQGTIFMMQRVKEWLVSTEQIRVAVGALEQGEKSGLHWQLVIKTIWGAPHLRDKLKSVFPELVGKQGNKANKYSVGVLRTSFENNIAYCLKGYKEIPDGEGKTGMSIFKGYEKEKALQLAEDIQAGVDERSGPQRTKPQSWNEVLYTHVCEAEAETSYEVGRAILTAYHRKKKTLPNKFQLSQLIATMKCMRHQEGSEELDYLFDDLISQAMSV